MLEAGDITYQDKRSLRKQLKQQGRFNIYYALRRPLSTKLRVYERMVRQDLTIRSAVNTRVDSIIGTIGMPVHPDPEIQEFHRKNLMALEDACGRSWETCLREIQFTKEWAGFAVSEVCYDLQFGILTLKDILTYHPSTIVIYPNKQGILTDGEDSPDGYHKSGIYQYAVNFAPAEVPLSLWKHIYLASDTEYGNLYGQSLVSPSYKWFRLKEVLIEMMITAMSKLGNRVLWVRSPVSPTDERVIDPSTGEERFKTTLQQLQEYLEVNEGDISHILLPQTSPGNDFKPEVGSVQMSDNFGETFINTLRYVDAESVRHILPYFLIMDSGSQESARERRMEVFYKAIYNQRKALTNVVVQKCLMPTQQWNFNRESAKIAPTFAKVFSDRPEDRVATMQMVTGLTDKGYLNPMNEMDWNMVREMVSLAGREMEEEDVQFIYDIVVEPLQKPEPAAGGGSEAVKKPSAGRPKGVSKPLSTPRAPAKAATTGTKANLGLGG